MADCNHSELETPYCPECGKKRRHHKEKLIEHLEFYRSLEACAHREATKTRIENQYTAWIALVEKHLP